MSSPNADGRTVGFTISGISFSRSPSKRAAQMRRVSQSPKMYAPTSSGNFLPRYTYPPVTLAAIVCGSSIAAARIGVGPIF